MLSLILLKINNAVIYLMGYPSRSLEDSRAESYVNSEGHLKKFQRETLWATGLEAILEIAWQKGRLRSTLSKEFAWVSI